MLNFRRRVHDGNELTNTPVTLQTANDNLTEGGYILLLYTIVNRDTVNHLVTIHLIPAGGSPTESNCIFEEVVLGQSTFTKRGPWWGGSLYLVKGTCDAADPNVSVRVTAFEEYEAFR